MNPTLYRRLSEVVEAALDLPAKDRPAFLNRECGNDPAVRSEAEALLAHASQLPKSVLASPLPGPGEDPATVDAPVQVATVDYANTDAPPAAQPEIPGYKILLTLGTGGMGVVYQAQDLKLPRLVALKMIKAGSVADKKEKLRFQAEAAAVAQLVHPNIVQIHEIGNHAGIPYFVLEYVEGGTLAQKMKGVPLTHRQAAETVMVLAKAVQAAHQHGIIHRDLKPANVLMTAEGTPKITDFGLAKQLDADQAISQAGDIMGTPPYMAPEQAFGRIQDIGPATDLYALGGILYEMLTGQPPFKGASTLETLELVRHQEPVSPRQLQPMVPRDLATICLKCLQKDRSQRYTSALALAQDLERFLAGEAILARPEGVLARLVRKVRRNRAVSLLGVALVLLALVAAVYTVYRGGRLSRVEDLEDRLKADRDHAAWTDAKIQAHETLIEQLTAQAPDRGTQAKKLLHESLLDSGTKRLQQPTALQPEDDAHVKRMIALLTTRDSAMVDRLQRTYQTRLRAWEEVFKVVFPKNTDQGLQKFGKAVIPRETMLTKERCQGNVRLEATWDAWETTSQIGLALHGDLAQEKTGYVFLLKTLEGPTFDEVRRKNGSVQLQILCNGVSLRKVQIPIVKLPKGPLRLEAQREADRLRVYVNQEISLECRDLVPLMPHGFYGIVWPKQATLKSLRGLRQALPIEPGPLERGDELFAQGNFDEARAFYGQQVIAAGSTPSGLEARYKESLALELLHRGEDAFRGYQSLAAEMTVKNANKWTVLASFQLWVHLLRNEKMDQADAILEGLVLHQAFENEENLILYLPDDVRGEILGKYRRDGSGFGLWRFDPKRLHNAKRLVQLEELAWFKFPAFWVTSTDSERGCLNG